MAGLMTDKNWKIFTFITGLLLVPLAGWVFTTSIQLSNLRVEYDLTAEQVKKMENHHTEIELVKQKLAEHNKIMERFLDKIYQPENKNK